MLVLLAGPQWLLGCRAEKRDRRVRGRCSMEARAFGAWWLNGDALRLDGAARIPLASPAVLRNDSFAEAACGEARWGAGRGLHPLPERLAPRRVAPGRTGRAARAVAPCSRTTGCGGAGVTGRGGTGSAGAWWEVLSHITEQEKITRPAQGEIFVPGFSRRLLPFNYAVPTPSLRLGRCLHPLPPWAWGWPGVLFCLPRDPGQVTPPG